MSLRDIKRAMEVMVWFYKRFQDFSCLMQDEENENEDDGESEDENKSEDKRPSVKQTLLTFDEERLTLEEARPTFKEERRNLSDHSRRFDSLKEEFIPKREVEEHPAVRASMSLPSFQFAPRKERAILEEETVSDFLPRQYFPYPEPEDILNFEDIAESLLVEEIVSTIYQVVPTVNQYKVTKLRIILIIDRTCLALLLCILSF